MLKRIVMSKTKEEFMEQEFTGSLDNMGDEDYLYEQYQLQEKLNEEYWEEQSKRSEEHTSELQSH